MVTPSKTPPPPRDQVLHWNIPLVLTSFIACRSPEHRVAYTLFYLISLPLFFFSLSLCALWPSSTSHHFSLTASVVTAACLCKALWYSSIQHISLSQTTHRSCSCVVSLTHLEPSWFPQQISPDDKARINQWMHTTNMPHENTPASTRSCIMHTYTHTHTHVRSFKPCVAVQPSNP